MVRKDSQHFSLSSVATKIGQSVPTLMSRLPWFATLNAWHETATKIGLENDSFVSEVVKMRERCMGMSVHAPYVGSKDKAADDVSPGQTKQIAITLHSNVCLCVYPHASVCVHLGANPGHYAYKVAAEVIREQQYY